MNASTCETKRTTLLLIVITAFGLSACGSNQEMSAGFASANPSATSNSELLQNGNASQQSEDDTQEITSIIEPSALGKDLKLMCGWSSAASGMLHGKSLRIEISAVPFPYPLTAEKTTPNVCIYKDLGDEVRTQLLRKSLHVEQIMASCPGFDLGDAQLQYLVQIYPINQASIRTNLIGQFVLHLGEKGLTIAGSYLYEVHRSQMPFTLTPMIFYRDISTDEFINQQIMNSGKHPKASAIRKYLQSIDRLCDYEARTTIELD